MANTLSVTYNGDDIVDTVDISSAVTKTLKCAGKLMESDVVISAEGGSGGGGATEPYIEYTFGEVVNPWSDPEDPQTIYAVTGVVIHGDFSHIPYEMFSGVMISSYDFTGVTEIEDYAFNGCAYLTGITLPEGLTKIGEGSFQETGETDFTVPSTVTEVGDYSFWTPNLRFIKFLGSTPPTGIEYCGGEGTLGHLIVPHDAVDAYGGATRVWKQMAAGETFPTYQGSPFTWYATLDDLDDETNPIEGTTAPSAGEYYGKINLDE